ncbi:MAG: tryptophan synthase subunit alpha [Candidatus Omnitrophota bacterium]
MNRIDQKFKQLKKQNKKALILYITAGDPSLSRNGELIPAFEKEGVDFVELGVPFSDPLADGVVIQGASQRALKRGTTLEGILGLVKKVRKHSQLPILLMSYLNPILNYGLDHFAASARKAGVDGLVVPDLPPEEGKEVSAAMRKRRIHLVYLLAPTSGPKRLKLVAKASKGFIYYVSLTGVTGVRKALPTELRRNILLAKKNARVPVCVGFGISTPEQAKAASRAADGVIVGSAIVRALARYPKLGAAAFSRRFVRPFARALGKEA